MVQIVDSSVREVKSDPSPFGQLVGGIVATTAANKEREQRLRRQAFTDSLNLRSQGFDATPEDVRGLQSGEMTFNDLQRTPEYGDRQELARQKEQLGLEKLKAEAEDFRKPYAETRAGRKFKAQEQIKAGFKSGKAGGLTPGQKKLDQEFAKDFSKFSVQGGFADAEKGIKQLSEVSQALSSSDNITGGLIGALPDFARKRILPKSAAAQQAVEEVVQRNLRLILGAQFTEKEGERLIQRAFDPSLDEAENKKRVDRLLNQMQTALQAKKEASDYFSKNGTLAGFQGKTSFTPDDFEPGGEQIQTSVAQQFNNQQARPDIIPSAQAAPNAQQHPEANQALQWARQNQQDPRAQQILINLGMQ